MSDPKRWRDEPNFAPLGVADLLSHAKRTRPMTSTQHARAALNVAKIAPAPAASVAGSILGTKTIAAGAFVSAVSLAVMAQSGPTSFETPPKPRAAEMSPSTRHSQQRAPRELVVAQAERNVNEPFSAVIAPRAPSPPAVIREVSAASPPATNDPAPLTVPVARDDSLARELARVDSARQSLETDPAGALREAEAHAREFPRGELAAERELIAINALLKLGRAAEARARGEALLASDPRSIYRERVRAILERAR